MEATEELSELTESMHQAEPSLLSKAPPPFSTSSPSTMLRLTEFMGSRVWIMASQGEYTQEAVQVSLCRCRCPLSKQNESFNQSYFKYGMELGCPTFVPVCDPEMGFEKIVRIAHARGVWRQKDIVAAMRIEREQAVQCMDAFLRVLTSIPGIDSHDANALAQAIGFIEAIAKASKEFIVDNTDLSTEKTERIVRFFRDPQYYLSPKLN